MSIHTSESMDAGSEIDVAIEADLSDVIQAVRDKSISQFDLMSVLLDNVDSDELITILIEEFGLKHARRLMMKTLKTAKVQARERRVKEIAKK